MTTVILSTVLPLIWRLILDLLKDYIEKPKEKVIATVTGTIDVPVADNDSCIDDFMRVLETD